MPDIRIKLILFIVIAGIICLHGQGKQLSEIKGEILDKSSKKPLKNVNVYLANSMVGTATDEKGKYVINGLAAGKYTLIASSIGYYHQVKEFVISGNKSRTINFRLTARAYELPTVNVIDEKDDEWHDNYDTFVKEFIGNTNNSDDTEIVNPYFIDFGRNGNDNLTAKIAEPLEIINHAMGYRILYFLERFEYDDLGSVRYAGYPVFEELVPPDDETKQEWDERRYDTYLGSFRHFIKAMSDSYLSKHHQNRDEPDSNITDPDAIDDYTTALYVVPPWEKKSYEYRMAVEPTSLLSPGDKPNELKLSFRNYLQVKYNTGFLTSQTSTLKLHADTVNIDINGRYNDEFKIQRFGHWADQRIADMLPLDYTPPKRD